MSVKENIIVEFKTQAKDYLLTLSIGHLRTYGRSKGVAQPTAINKETLIDSILAVLVGEVAPIKRNGKGAPIKDNYVDPKIDEEVEKCYNDAVKKYSGEQTQDANLGNVETIDYGNVEKELADFINQKNVLRVEDPNAKAHSLESVFEKNICVGQLQTVDGISMLLPLNGKENFEKIIVPIECIRANDLREGDVISCYAEDSRNMRIVTEILTINDLVKGSLRRGVFDELDVCYPNKRIKTYNGKNDTITAKYLQWLIPIGKGQRAVVVSSPKAGKTSFLYETVQSISNIKQNISLFTLLIEQAPESITRFRKILLDENLIYSSYDDMPERQVFLAEFLLNRAKRMAESGKDVVLAVDSLNALAKAFNETNESIGGKTLAYGLESKTLHFIKKFLGTAHGFERGGSITIIASLSKDTGNPVDDLLYAELSTVANLRICLNEDLAKQRLYPSIDLLQTHVEHGQFLLNEDEQTVYEIIKNKYSTKDKYKELLTILKDCSDFSELYKTITVE